MTVFLVPLFNVRGFFRSLADYRPMLPCQELKSATVSVDFRPVGYLQSFNPR
jgi:hypothetical protein